MKTVAFTPDSRAASATAWPWLPELAVTTPAARSASSSDWILLNAPRILNDPVRWRFSAFRKTGRPLRRPRVSDEKTGVMRARLAMRVRAASMSARPGIVSIAMFVHFEYLLHDLPNRGQRVELTALNLVQKASQLGIVGDGLLQVSLRAGARDGEDLRSE